MPDHKRKTLAEKIEALKTAGDLPEHGIELVDALIDLADSYKGTDPHKAERYAAEAQGFAKKIAYDRGIARSSNCIGISRWARGNYKEAHAAFKAALRINTRLNDKNGIGNVLNNIGLTYWREGELSNAIRHYEKSLRLFRETGNKHNEGSTCANIAIIYVTKKNYEKGLYYNLKALEIFQETDDKKYSANVCDNIGNIYFYSQDLEKASQYYEKSLLFRKEISDEIGVAISYQKIGQVYKEKNCFNEALEYQERSLKILKRVDDLYHIFHSYKCLGEIYTDIEDYETASGYFFEALELAERCESKNEILDIYENLTKLFEKTEDYRKGFEYYKKFSELRDEIFTEELNERLSKMEVRHELERKEKEAEIEHLKNVELKKEIEERIKVERALRESEERFRRLSIEDPLTGVFNRRYFFEIANKALKRIRSGESVFAVALIDLDHFKRINDTHGHQFGDEVLKSFVGIAKNMIRPDDRLARYGGEEFIMLLSGCNSKEAGKIIERIRRSMEMHEFRIGDAAVSITISAGLSDTTEISDGDSSIDDLIHIADKRLYAAKTLGRNRVHTG